VLRLVTRTLRSSLIAALAMLPAGALATPALAGETGNGCLTYYYHNNPATHWGFTVCVKAVHDAARHTWETVGSVSTTTPGMTLHTAVAQVAVHNGFSGHGALIDSSLGVKGPAASRILDIRSGTAGCGGVGNVEVRGEVAEQVHWPNGELSSPTHTTWFGESDVMDDPANPGIFTTC
jgi:hypothetical protein